MRPNSDFLQVLLSFTKIFPNPKFNVAGYSQFNKGSTSREERSSLEKYPRESFSKMNSFCHHTSIHDQLEPKRAEPFLMYRHDQSEKIKLGKDLLKSQTLAKEKKKELGKANQRIQNPTQNKVLTWMQL